MAINFPSSPTIGQTYTSSGKTWTWTGAAWEGIPAKIGIPSGATSGRPVSPAIGDQFYNGTLGVLEIYTSSGWLPATGANDFNIAVTGPDTSVTFNKEYFEGAYTITSSLGDGTVDIYLLDSSGSYAGYTSTPSVVATKNFNKVVIIGGTTGDLLSFAYKTTFTSASEDSILNVGPVITSTSPSYMKSVDDSITITGKNFAQNVQVKFVGIDDVDRNAKSVVRSSATQLIVTRPDDFPESVDPYTIVITNPGISSPIASLRNRLTNSVTSGATPVWQTAAALSGYAISGLSYSQQLSATDPDGGNVVYSLVSGILPGGLSISSSGLISGTPTDNPSNSSTQVFTIRATDTGGNYIDRQFSLTWSTTLAPISADAIAASYLYLYRIATSAAEAQANVTKMQGYASQITATLTNSGKATNAGAWGGNWPFDITQGPTNGKIFLGLNGTDDGDSNTTLFQVNEAGQTQVYYRNNTSFSDQSAPVVFRGARLIMGGGSVGTMYVSNVWTLTAP